MLQGSVRMSAYRSAILESVKNGDVVADIGTGSGILAFYAIQAGAERVYAIEQDSIIEEAKELARRSGMESKIVFIRGRSDRIELPERVDVITSELIGIFGLEENLLGYQVDARNRFLKKGGRMVPNWIELHLIPVQSHDIWEKHIGFWNQDVCGIDFSPVRDGAVSERYALDTSERISLLADPCQMAHIDFYHIDAVPNLFRSKIRIKSSGELHGLLGYFSSGLSPNISFSTSPEAPRTHWGQIFFPMQETVSVQRGDAVEIRLKSIAYGDTIYWQWHTQIQRGVVPVCAFTQSNLRIPERDVSIGNLDFKPSLDSEGKIYRMTLDLCDGSRTIEEISEIVRTKYPATFTHSAQARRKVIGIIRHLVSI